MHGRASGSAARDEVEALELNLSCPNVDEVPENVGEVVAAVRAVDRQAALREALRRGRRPRCHGARRGGRGRRRPQPRQHWSRASPSTSATLQPVLARGDGRALRSGAAAGRARGCPHAASARRACRSSGWAASRRGRHALELLAAGRERRRGRHRALRRPRRGDRDPVRAARPSWRRSASPILTTPSVSRTPPADVDPRPEVETRVDKNPCILTANMVG